MVRIPGWVALPCSSPDARWRAVQDHTIEAPAGLTTPADIHRWTRSHVQYQRDFADHWSTPAETLARGVGDCEDFAILERAMLIAAGFCRAQIWVVVAHDLVIREDHAFLIAGEQVLDCRSDEIIDLASLTDYRPIIAFRDAEMVMFGRGRG